MKKIDELLKELYSEVHSEFKKIQTMSFIPEDTDDDNEYIYELPTTFEVDKHGHHTDYYITSVTRKNDELIFEGTAFEDSSYSCDFYAHDFNLLSKIDILKYIQNEKSKGK